MAKLLLTCPARSRPQLLSKMINSFIITKSDDTDLVIGLDNDDDQLQNYINLCNNNNIKFEISRRDNVAYIHNRLANNNPNYDYYMPVNDDIVFRTNNWDTILVSTIEEKGSGWGISYGKDYDANKDIYYKPYPTFGMISGNIVKRLGYLYPPNLKAFYGDTFLLDFGRSLGRLFYCEEVLIQHKQEKIEDDPRLVPSFKDEEMKNYSNYIDTRLDDDINKIFEAIVNSKSLQEA